MHYFSEQIDRIFESKWKGRIWKVCQQNFQQHWWFAISPQKIKWQRRGGHVGWTNRTLLLSSSNMAAMTSHENDLFPILTCAFVFFPSPLCVRYRIGILYLSLLPCNIRELKQNSWGRRRSLDKTNYTKQKAHVNMWNKVDICAVLLSNETSTAPFPRCLQNVTDISRPNVHRFVQEETLESTEFQRKQKHTG